MSGDQDIDHHDETTGRAPSLPTPNVVGNGVQRETKCLNINELLQSLKQFVEFRK